MVDDNFLWSGIPCDLQQLPELPMIYLYKRLQVFTNGEIQKKNRNGKCKKLKDLKLN